MRKTKPWQSRISHPTPSVWKLPPSLHGRFNYAHFLVCCVDSGHFMLRFQFGEMGAASQAHVLVFAGPLQALRVRIGDSVASYGPEREPEGIKLQLQGRRCVTHTHTPGSCQALRKHIKIIKKQRSFITNPLVISLVCWSSARGCDWPGARMRSHSALKRDYKTLIKFTVKCLSLWKDNLRTARTVLFIRLSPSVFLEVTCYPRSLQLHNITTKLPYSQDKWAMADTIVFCDRRTRTHTPLLNIHLSQIVWVQVILWNRPMLPFISTARLLHNSPVGIVFQRSQKHYKRQGIPLPHQHACLSSALDWLPWLPIRMQSVSQATGIGSQSNGAVRKLQNLWPLESNKFHFTKRGCTCRSVKIL